MKSIGVRQLKNEATQIVRTVREQHALYVITVNGEPVATLRPYSERDIAGVERGHAAVELQAIERLAESVGASWHPVGAVAEPGEQSSERAGRGL